MRHCWGTTTMPHTRSGHDRDRSRDHPLRGITPVKGHYTQSERVQCLRIGCTAPRHKLTDLPERTSTDPTGLAGPGGNEPQTANRARGRQGLTGLRDDEPSGRLAAQTTSGPPSARLAALRGIKPGRVAPAPPSPDGRAHIQRARARGTHTTRPGPAARNSTTEPRPREKIKPSDPP